MGIIINHVQERFQIYRFFSRRSFIYQVRQEFHLSKIQTIVFVRQNDVMNFPTSEETTKLHIKRVHKNTGYGKPIISIMFLINIYNQKKYSTPHFSKKKKKKKIFVEQLLFCHKLVPLHNHMILMRIHQHYPLMKQCRIKSSEIPKHCLLSNIQVSWSKQLPNCLLIQIPSRQN